MTMKKKYICPETAVHVIQVSHLMATSVSEVLSPDTDITMGGGIKTEGRVKDHNLWDDEW